MYFSVRETFCDELKMCVYDIRREEQLLYKDADKAELEKFIMDRNLLHDTDLVDYSWGHGCITGQKAREILAQKDIVPFVDTTGTVWSCKGTISFGP